MATGSSHRRGSEPDDVTKTRSRSRDKLNRENGSSPHDFVCGSSHRHGNLIGSEADDIPKIKRSLNRDKLRREESFSRGDFITGSSHKDEKLIGSEADKMPYDVTKTRSRSRDKLKRENSSSRGDFVGGSSHKHANLIGSEVDDIPKGKRSDKLKRENNSSRGRFTTASLHNDEKLIGSEADEIPHKIRSHDELNRQKSSPARREEATESEMEERHSKAEETLRIKHEKQSKKHRSIIPEQPRTRKQELSKIKKFRLDIEVLLMAAESDAKELKEEKMIISSEIDEMKASNTQQSVFELLVSQKQKLSKEIKKNRKERGEIKDVIRRLKKLYDKIPNLFIHEVVEEQETLESIIAEFSGGATLPAPNSSARMTMCGHRTRESESMDNPLADREPRLKAYRKRTSAPNASTRPTASLRRTSSEPNRDHHEKTSRRPQVERGRSIGSHIGLRDGKKYVNPSGSLPLFSKYATEDLNASGWLYLNITSKKFRDLAELARNSAPDLPVLAMNSESSSCLQTKREKVRQAEENLKAMNMTVRSLRSVVSDEQSLGLDIEI